MTELIGWLGGVLLALCGFPLVVETWQKGVNRDNLLFLLIWYLGDWFTIAYVVIQHGLDLPLLFNYGLNISFLTYILYKHERFDK